jgi:hypothetical protein
MLHNAPIGSPAGVSPSVWNGKNPCSKEVGSGRVPIPRCAQEITTAWLSRALAPHLQGCSVLGSQARPHTEPGQTADIVELWLHYDSAHCPLPERMIAKLAASDPSARDVCRTFNMYEREAGFYREFDSTTLPIARCFHADFDALTQDTVILLEHLAPSYCPSYGISTEQVRTAIREAARLHARFWNDPFVRDYPGLVKLDDLDFWSSSASGALAAVGKVESLVGSACAASVEAIRAYAANLEAILAYARTRPFTLVHSDYHPKQIFFPTEDNQGKFAIIDFQFSITGPGAWDISRLIQFGLDIELRRTMEAELIGEYLAALASHGVEGYDSEAIALDHKLGTMLTQSINFIAINQTDSALIESECAAHGLNWIDVWLARGDAMIRDLDVPTFLRSL